MPSNLLQMPMLASSKLELARCPIKDEMDTEDSTPVSPVATSVSPLPSRASSPPTSVGTAVELLRRSPVETESGTMASSPTPPRKRGRLTAALPEASAMAINRPEPAPKRRNVGGRPRIHSSTPPKARGPTRLRKGRTVVSRVPMDIWQEILAYCPGKFLAKARRINKSFHQVLSYESLWKKNRLQIHGADLPDPFPGMREDQYANLLEGLGCMECGNPKTRKTYWPWRVRWCADCLHKNTVKQEDAATTLLRQDRELLSRCIPYGVVDSWGNYEMAGEYDRSWSRQGHGRHRVYAKKDICAILAERDAFVASNPEKADAALQAWIEVRAAARDKAMERIQKIEDWVETRARGKINLNSKLKQERAEYFTKRAAELNPPLGSSALALIQAYKRAIDIPRAPSERAWRALVPKLQRDQEAAQAAVDAKEARAQREDRDQIEREEYLRRMSSRLEGNTAEQRMVAAIATRVVDGLRRAEPPTADADFPLLALRQVREDFYKIQRARRCRSNPYTLVLEDARWAWEKCIRPEMESWGPGRSKAAQSFKCPGCARNDVHVRYGFEALFIHLRHRHAPALGDFHTLFRDGLETITDFHWLNIEWPANLPILADHHVASGRWDPNDRRPYLRAPSLGSGSVTGSAFANRTVCLDDRRHDATANMVHAGRLLRDTGLAPTLKTKIVMEFAMRKYQALRRGMVVPANVEYIRELPLALIRAGVYDLFDNFRCAACLDRDRATPRKLTKLHSPESLIEHFRLWHASEMNWATDMIKLPSDEELWRKLNGPGQAKALAAFTKMFPARPATCTTSEPSESL